MKVRFLADADLNRAILSGALRREPSLDFLTAQAAGLRGMNDPEVLALAAERNACSFHMMQARCRLTTVDSGMQENIAREYS